MSASYLTADVSLSLSPVSGFHAKSDFFSSSFFDLSIFFLAIFFCPLFDLSIFSVVSLSILLSLNLFCWFWCRSPSVRLWWRSEKRSDFFKGISFKWKQGSRQGWNSYKRRDQTVSTRTSLVCFLKNCLKLMSMVIYLMILRKVKSFTVVSVENIETLA